MEPAQARDLEQKSFNIDRIDLNIARKIDVKSADIIWQGILQNDPNLKKAALNKLDSSLDNSKQRDLVYIRSICNPEVMSASNLLLERMNHLNYHFPGDLSIAVLDDKGLVALQNTDNFPMVGIYKLQLGYAVVNKMNQLGHGTMDTIDVPRANIRSNTFSPLYDRVIISGYGDLHSRTKPTIPPSVFKFCLGDLLYYSVGIADNNATDILMNQYLGGPKELEKFLHKQGFTHTVIQANSNDVSIDIENSYLNNAPTYEVARSFANYILDESISKPQRRIIENSLFFTKSSQNRIERGILRALYNKQQYETYLANLSHQHENINKVSYRPLVSQDNSYLQALAEKNNYTNTCSCCNKKVSYRNAVITNTEENKRILDIDVISFASGATKIAPNWEPNHKTLVRHLHSHNLDDSNYLATNLTPNELSSCCNHENNVSIAEALGLSSDENTFAANQDASIHNPQEVLMSTPNHNYEQSYLPAINTQKLTASIRPINIKHDDNPTSVSEAMNGLEIVNALKDNAHQANTDLSDTTQKSNAVINELKSTESGETLISTINSSGGSTLIQTANSTANHTDTSEKQGVLSMAFNKALFGKRSNESKAQHPEKYDGQHCDHKTGLFAAKNHSCHEETDKYDKDNAYLSFIPTMSFSQFKKDMPDNFVIYSRTGMGGINANGKRVAVNDLAYVEIDGHPFIVAVFTKNIGGDPASSIITAEEAIANSVEYIFDYISILKRYE